MKTFIFIITIIFLLALLVSCAPTPIDENGYPIDLLVGYADYVVISNGKNYHLTYNRNTYIVYDVHCVHNGHSFMPHYIIGEDGCVHFTKWEDGKIVEIPNTPLD